MLIIEIAFGVFIGGFGLWLLFLRHEKKKQAKHDEEQIQAAFSAAEVFIKQRFETITAAYHEEIRRKVLEILDDPNSSLVSAFAGETQVNMSSDHFSHFKMQVASEAQNALQDGFSMAARIGASERFKQYIDQLIDSACESLQNASSLLLLNEMQSLNDDELPSITKGHPRKQFILGNAYRLGQNVDQDYIKAESLLFQSASQGYTNAQSVLGYMYLSGEGIAQNFSEAIRWLRPAAENGDQFAQNCLGLMYLNGQGIPQDYEQANRLFTLSANQGFEAAYANLGRMYFDGKGVTQDYVLALMWFLLAEEKEPQLAGNEIRTALAAMTAEQAIEAERQAILRNRSVLELLLRMSHDLLDNPIPLYYEPTKLAEYFAAAYLESFWKGHLWIVSPTPEEMERWSVSDTELLRCKEEGVLVAALGILVTIKKNKDPDFYGKFRDALAENVSALLSWKSGEDASVKVLDVIDNYIEALEAERVFSFAANFTERVFDGNPNESTIFAENFWDRAFAVGMAAMGASKEFVSWCMAIEMKHEILKDTNVGVGEVEPIGFLRLIRELDAKK